MFCVVDMIVKMNVICDVVYEATLENDRFVTQIISSKSERRDNYMKIQNRA